MLHRRRGRRGAGLPGRSDPFGEAPGRAFVVSGAEADLAQFEVIGRVGGSELELEGMLKIAVSDLREAYERGLEYV